MHIIPYIVTKTDIDFGGNRLLALKNKNSFIDMINYIIKFID
jgi:hypothetical protein